MYVRATDKKANEMEMDSRPEAGDAAGASQEISEIKVKKIKLYIFIEF